MHYLPLQLAALLAWAASASANVDVGSANYTQLATKLSGTAQIYLPGSDAFNAAVARWSNLSTPVANVVVVPSNEYDIVETVKLLSSPLQYSDYLGNFLSLPL